ncbi:FMN-binding negative transcriptional regulator [Saccharothrix australiensis]|uniref:PaiB family negative transcriptional regulator n=1 Tax=Saccharothrix australiensis TaxID=2072 RepID=A0A495VZ05_9PSEU|nr:FMN-binding negative transcriptional regulator [Saccharothrix australiensis]RKT54662.1 PaiB family negative transcriptional regulator [Saccharothrix australiensis]
MHVPSIYRADEGWSRLVVRRYPLAVLTTNGADVPHATHLPIVPESDVDEPGSGTVLFGHMNRANPHWRDLAPGTAGRLLFSGPHGYVSPAGYDPGPAAPTWNFVSAHVTGTVFPIGDPEEALAVVARTARLFEESFGDGWDSAGSLAHFRRILPGVGAFRFEVAEVDVMAKLSQEKTPAERARVAHRLDAGTSGTARDLAELMRWSFGGGATPP